MPLLPPPRARDRRSGRKITFSSTHPNSSEAPRTAARRPPSTPLGPNLRGVRRVDWGVDLRERADVGWGFWQPEPDGAAILGGGWTTAPPGPQRAAPRTRERGDGER